MSSDDLAISIRGLSKCFQIYNAPKDRLKQFILPRFQKIFGNTVNQYFQEFWALKNLSFEVRKGETIGIIGRNGSGKSTLLQIICGTLTPTSGEVETRGRVAALLELGSGFNPEFTGRENVYLNASVLGLTKDEVDLRFEDIIAFADIGDFIEQPVKTYSSGMMLRLAFAVIAHVDADILIVDEALAVGDAVFTQKCMRFIRAFQKKGTLLFVSHDMGAVQNLCQKSIWLDKGVQRQIGPSKDIAEAYLQSTLQYDYGDDLNLENSAVNESANNSEPPPKEVEQNPLTASNGTYQGSIKDNLSNAKGWHTGSAEIIEVLLESLENGVKGVYQGGEKVRVTIRVKANDALENPILGFIVKDRLGQDLFGENTLSFTDLSPSPIKPQQVFTGEFVFNFPMLPNGEYAVMVSVADGTREENIQHHYLHDALIINVYSDKVRYGLVGIPFEQVKLKIK